MRSGAQGSAGAAAGASGRLLQSTLYHVPLEEVSPHNSGPLALPCRMRRGFGFGRAVGRGFGLLSSQKHVSCIRNRDQDTARPSSPKNPKLVAATARERGEASAR